MIRDGAWGHGDEPRFVAGVDVLDLEVAAIGDDIDPLDTEDRTRRFGGLLQQTHFDDLVGDLLLDDSAQCGSLHIHRATRHGLAGRHLFAPDIHHARPALGIHMRPCCHGLLLRLGQRGHEFRHPRDRLRQFSGIRATALRHVRAPTAFATHERGHLP